MSEELTFQEKASLPACIQCDGYREDFPWEKTAGVVIAPDESYISFSSTASRLDYFLFNSKGTPDPGTDDCEVIAELSYAGLASGSYGRSGFSRRRRSNSVQSWQLERGTYCKRVSAGIGTHWSSMTQKKMIDRRGAFAPLLSI